MPRKKVRTGELRASVLDVALGLLEDEGPASCTTRRIAKLAGTSPPALYEFFGDKNGLLREVFFEGFRILGRRLQALARTNDTRADLEDAVRAFRGFALEHPALSELMFSRPFSIFAPAADDLEAGNVVRSSLVGRARRCVESGVIGGDATDIAHNVLALAMGLATQERAGWLGSTPASVERRWELGIRALLDGLSG